MYVSRNPRFFNDAVALSERRVFSMVWEGLFDDSCFLGLLAERRPLNSRKKGVIIRRMHVVLYEPDIPGNTGNVARSCVATGSTLHLVGRLGFVLDDSKLKRAGLDYWSKLKLERHSSWDAFAASLPVNASLFFFSKHAQKRIWPCRFTSTSYLVFGCETERSAAELPSALPRPHVRDSDATQQCALVEFIHLGRGRALRQALRQCSTSAERSAFSFQPGLTTES